MKNGKSNVQRTKLNKDKIIINVLDGFFKHFFVPNIISINEFKKKLIARTAKP